MQIDISTAKLAPSMKVIAILIAFMLIYENVFQKVNIYNLVVSIILIMVAFYERSVYLGDRGIVYETRLLWFWHQELIDFGEISHAVLFSGRKGCFLHFSTGVMGRRIKVSPENADKIISGLQQAGVDIEDERGFGSGKFTKA